MELGKVAKNVIKCVATGEVRAKGLYWCPFFAKFDIRSCDNLTTVLYMFHSYVWAVFQCVSSHCISLHPSQILFQSDFWEQENIIHHSLLFSNVEALLII